MTEAEYKLTYPVEVEYLGGKKETIQFPRMSSDAFLAAMSELTTTDGLFHIKITYGVVKFMVPGLLKLLTVKSGNKLVKKVMEMEKDNFDLGELLEPDPDGKSERPESSPASS